MRSLSKIQPKQGEKSMRGQRADSGMYLQSVKQWNPFVGCENECIYCIKSFQKFYKRFWRNIYKPNGNIKCCEECRDYIPHEHPERLDQHLPQTKKDQFIFVVSSGDISFASKNYIKKILGRIRELPDRNFLIQTKDPEKLLAKIKTLPKNISLDVTLETNRDKDYRKISKKAPLPSKRFQAHLKFQHPTKFLTIEPIFDFDESIFLDWIPALNPDRVYIGYESKGVSKKYQLPEPSLAKTMNFIDQLRAANITVYTKLLRKAWWEK